MNDDKVNAYQTARELMPLTAGYDHAEAWRFALWLLDAESEAAAQAVLARAVRGESRSTVVQRFVRVTPTLSEIFREVVK